MKVDKEPTKLLSSEKFCHTTLLLAPNFWADQIPMALVFHRNNLQIISFTCSYTSLGDIMTLSQIVFSSKISQSTKLEQFGIKKLPKQLDQLRRFRYLNLSSNGDLKKLPEEICYLYNLHTLRIKTATNLKKN